MTEQTTYCVRCKGTWQRPTHQYTDYCPTCQAHMLENTRRCNAYDARGAATMQTDWTQLAARANELTDNAQFLDGAKLYKQAWWAAKQSGAGDDAIMGLARRFHYASGNTKEPIFLY